MTQSILQKIFDRIDNQLKECEELWGTPQPYSMKNAQRNAACKNRKADAAAPLLAHAGLVEHISAEQLKEKVDVSNERYFNQILNCDCYLAQEAKRMATKLSKLISENELADLEAYRVRNYPLALEYDADFFHRKLNELAPDKMEENHA
jgi:hypothetical protein